MERFQREIRTQARLHHPHILPVFDAGLAAGHLYYVMPHVGPARCRIGSTAKHRSPSRHTAEAIRAGRRAVALPPLTTDAASGLFLQTYLQTYLAQIHLRTRELDKAAAMLRPLLTFPSWTTPAELTSDPLWAPLRPHPGFASLAAPTP